MAFRPWYPKNGASAPDLPESPWDTVVLGGYTLPGKARIARASVGWKLDPKHPPGRDSARPTSHGFEPKDLEIEVTVTTVEQMDALGFIMLELAPRRGGVFQPVSIEAQQIDDLDITDVLLLEVGAWTESTSPRGWKRSLRCKVWAGTDKATARTNAKRKAKTPLRSIRNARAEAAREQDNRNPAPTEQANACGPNFTSAGG